MKTSPLPLRSIKARTSPFTLLIFVTSLWSLSFHASRMLKGDLVRLAGEQQLTSAHFVAEQVNGQLSDSIAALEGVASIVDAHHEASQAELIKWPDAAMYRAKQGGAK